jgi:hypothetical protein
MILYWTEKSCKTSLIGFNVIVAEIGFIQYEKDNVKDNALPTWICSVCKHWYLCISFSLWKATALCCSVISCKLNYMFLCSMFINVFSRVPGVVSRNTDGKFNFHWIIFKSYCETYYLNCYTGWVKKNWHLCYSFEYQMYQFFLTHPVHLQ